MLLDTSYMKDIKIRTLIMCQDRAGIAALNDGTRATDIVRVAQSPRDPQISPDPIRKGLLLPAARSAARASLRAFSCLLVPSRASQRLRTPHAPSWR